MAAPKNNKFAQKGPIKRSVQIAIRITPQMKEKIDRIASEKNMSLAEVVMEAVSRMK